MKLFTIDELKDKAYAEALNHVAFVVKATLKKDVDLVRVADVQFLEAVARKMEFKFDAHGDLRRIDYKQTA